MDVSDEECDQELSILLTPPDSVNKAKTVTTADFLPEKSYQLYHRRNAMISFLAWCKKIGTVRFSLNVIIIRLNNHNYADLIICEHIYHIAYEGIILYCCLIKGYVLVLRLVLFSISGGKNSQSFMGLKYFLSLEKTRPMA
jgi:hypothetical protein